MSFFTKIFGDPNARVIAAMQPIVDQVNSFSVEFEKLSDEELKAKTAYFKERLAKGETLDDILPEAFATIREANRRTIGVRHYDVQLIGGIVLHRGEIAEMRTGEGKTHVAALALYLNALAGQGAHLVTVNDYLAKRDAGWNGVAFNLLGMRTSCLINMAQLIYDPEYTDETADDRVKHLRPCSRREAYAADITYGTNSEFGFDYLRDNMVGSLKQMVQRGHVYAIVDEVDSVLIDEARTPLIISAPAEESAGLYKKFSQIVPRLSEATDYNIDEKLKTATLTEEGIEKIEKVLGLGNIYTDGGIEMVHHLEQALRAHALYKLDRDYVVKDGEVIIIDEFTGRMMFGRRYSEGLHQAIEAKENVEVQKESRTLATITIQNYFRMYHKLAGMTGTASTEAEEFHKIYGLEVTTIPTNKPVARDDSQDRIYATEKGKLIAVVREIKELQAKGQPVLVGTISVEKNEYLALLLKQANIKFEILNAKNHEREAEIIAQAGKVGAVTVATNMAGRGVDIMLGGSPFDADENARVKELGGLFVLGTERHEARRIDNQLRGRAGRQGDPGASQFYVSMEDDLMRIFGSDRVKGLMQRLGVAEDEPIENGMISGSIEKAQMKVEGNNFDIRKHLVEYDDVINKQREIIYKKRKAILESAKDKPEVSKEMMWDMLENEVEQIVSFHTAGDDQSLWNLKEIGETVKTIFPMTVEELAHISSLEKISGNRLQDAESRTQIIEYLLELAKRNYEALEKTLAEQSGDETAMRQVEREILLHSIDSMWVDHLDAISLLRTGIGLRGYGQRDPLIEYKRETYNMFLELQNLIQHQAVYSIFKIRMATQMADSLMAAARTNKADFAGPVQFGELENSSSTSPNPLKPVQPVSPYESIQKEVAANNQAGMGNNANKVGRNDLCPCGSGKKSKKCCG